MPSVSRTQPDASPLPMRDAVLRLNDFYEVYERPDPSRVKHEAARCMNCGAAFCMPQGGYRDNAGAPAGCPISNKIPEWNRLVETGRWRDAYDRLALTNNFPEFTARVCPAPCEASCIVGIHDRPVGIKSIERAIIDRAFDKHWVKPTTPDKPTGKRIAVVGSGPAGLAAADQLNALGHRVTVYERADTPGGLLTYGIPSMKLDKAVVARRVALLEQAGITFQTGRDIGTNLGAPQLLADHDATLLAIGALAGRELDLPGRELAGITMAMPYLEAATRHRLHHTPLPEALDAQGKHVVVIGGGDTGVDCIATALRQRATSVTNITQREQPTASRDADHPWPGPPATYTLDYAHAEGRALTGHDPRRFNIQPLAFRASPDGQRVAGLDIEESAPGQPIERRTLPANLIILAIGFTGPDTPALLDALQLQPADLRKPQPRPHLFIAGDARTGPSLVVHAIAQGRAAAATIHTHLPAR